MEYKCNYCDYISSRKYNVNRHYKSKHNIINNNNEIIEEDNKTINDNKLNNNLYSCDKCGKSYKTKKYYDNHNEKCIGISIFTCPRCMKTFSSSSTKIRHIKNNKCKPRSIIYAKKPDIIININNTINNTINNINNITINNYGSERTDYITFDDIIKILKLSGNSIIPKYIQLKHFNKDFPENHNIKYEKNNNCFIKKNNEWIITDIDNLSTNLIKKNSNELEYYYIKNKNQIENKIMNIDLIDYIHTRLSWLDLQLNIPLYKSIKSEVKSLIKTIII